MDRFKLEIFKKESEKDFTFYKTLSMEESSSLIPQHFDLTLFISS